MKHPFSVSTRRRGSLEENLFQEMETCLKREDPHGTRTSGLCNSRGLTPWRGWEYKYHWYLGIPTGWRCVSASYRKYTKGKQTGKRQNKIWLKIKKTGIYILTYFILSVIFSSWQRHQAEKTKIKSIVSSNNKSNTCPQFHYKPNKQ